MTGRDEEQEIRDRLAELELLQEALRQARELTTLFRRPVRRQEEPPKSDKQSA